MNHLRHICLIAGLALFLNAACQTTANAQQKKNVLFIAVDDLRPELGCYGKEYMKTPNFDALASRGVLFENAFCMVPTCGASRASVMSSRRPAPTRFTSHLTWLSKEVPDATPLHTHFKNNGYTTISIGKIFHHAKDHIDGWSEKPLRSKSMQWFNREAEQASIVAYKEDFPNSPKGTRGPSTESANVEDSRYGDGESADAAIKKLEQFSKTQTSLSFWRWAFTSLTFHSRLRKNIGTCTVETKSKSPTIIAFQATFLAPRYTLLVNSERILTFHRKDLLATRNRKS